MRRADEEREPGQPAAMANGRRVRGALVGELKATGVLEHVAVRLKAELGRNTSRATILRHAAVLEGSPERARAVLLSALRKIRYAMTSSSQGA